MLRGVCSTLANWGSDDAMEVDERAVSESKKFQLEITIRQEEYVVPE